MTAPHWSRAQCDMWQWLQATAAARGMSVAAVFRDVALDSGYRLRRLQAGMTVLQYEAVEWAALQSTQPAARQPAPPPQPAAPTRVEGEAPAGWDTTCLGVWADTTCLRMWAEGRIGPDDWCEGCTRQVMNALTAVDPQLQWHASFWARTGTFEAAPL